jgi:hypothetical protein
MELKGARMPMGKKISQFLPCIHLKAGVRFVIQSTYSI